MLVPKGFINSHQGPGTVLGGIFKGARSSTENKTKCTKPVWPSAVTLGKVCVDQGHQRIPAREGGPVLLHHCIPDHVFTAYLCTENILAQMLYSVLNCRFGCPIVSLVWHICQEALSSFIKRDEHGASGLREHLVFEERAVCSSRFEMQVPKGLIYWRHISPTQRCVSELRQDVSCPWA